MKTLVFFSLFLFLVSCNTYKKIQLTECDHPSGYCKEIRNEANRAWKYALLSNNVYLKKQYKTDSLFVLLEKHEKPELSYYSELYKDINTNEYILAFRGTDSKADFQTGNNPINQEQNRYALEIYDKIKAKHGIDSLIATGHSLGGGISTHLSLNREKIKTFIFNSSPVFKSNKNTIVNERHSIAERGEILKITRLLGREANQTYTSLNCTKGDPIKQHGILLLTNCLIKIASYSDNSINSYYLQ